jgi:hypothetical protein
MNPEPESPPEPKTHDPYEGGPLGAGIDWSDPNSPLARFYMSAGGVVCVTLLGLLFLLFSSVPLAHTDFWSHLKYGEWIAAERRLPDIEPLNPFTDKQKPMFDAMWLTQLGYHEVFRLGEWVAHGDDRRRFEGGVEAVRAVHALAAIAVLALAGLAYRRSADSVPWAIGGILIVVALLLQLLAVQRPQVFALDCFAALLCLLSRGAPSRRGLVLIPLVMLLWANLHGSFVVGFALLGLMLLGRAFEVSRAVDWSFAAVLRDPGVRRLGLALALALLAACLNPYGPELYLNVVRFSDSPNLRTMAEWQPLDFSQPRGGHWGYLAAAILLLATQIASPRPFSPTQMMLILTFGVWPLLQQRAMAWWVLLLPWIIAPHWSAVWEGWGLSLPDALPSFRKTALAVLIVMAIVFISPPSHWARSGRARPTAQALNHATPNDIAAALAGQPPADPDRVADVIRVVRDDYQGRFRGRIFSSERLGEYLLWALPPDAPVMMYNHAQLFSTSYWSECLRTKEAALGWWEVLDRREVEAVVLEASLCPELCAELRSNRNWRVALDESASDRPALVRDPAARLFVAFRKHPDAPGSAK